LAALHPPQKSPTVRRRQVAEVVAAVADELGNTPSVCRKSYIYPGVIDRFLADGALKLVARAAKKGGPPALSASERAVVGLIERIVAAEHRPLSETLAASVRAARKKKRAPGARRAA
jgi:DNA topoisomerase-1